MGFTNESQEFAHLMFSRNRIFVATTLTAVLVLGGAGTAFAKRGADDGARTDDRRGASVSLSVPVTTPTPRATIDDKGGNRPAGVSDDTTSSTVKSSSTIPSSSKQTRTRSRGADDTVSSSTTSSTIDDHGGLRPDGVSDDVAGDDHGGRTAGDDSGKRRGGHGSDD